MAQLQLTPPEPFNFQKRYDEWPIDKLAEGADRQINTLLYCFGDESDSVLASIPPDDTEDGRLSFQNVILKEHVSIDETKHQESQQKSTLWFCTS